MPLNLFNRAAKSKTPNFFIVVTVLGNTLWFALIHQKQPLFCRPNLEIHPLEAAELDFACKSGRERGDKKLAPSNISIEHEERIFTDF